MQAPRRGVPFACLELSFSAAHDLPGPRPSSLHCSAPGTPWAAAGPQSPLSPVTSSRLLPAAEKGASPAPCQASAFRSAPRNLQKIFPLAADERVVAPDMPSRRRPGRVAAAAAAAASRRGHGHGESRGRTVSNGLSLPRGLERSQAWGRGPKGPSGGPNLSEAPGVWPPCQGRGRPSRGPDPGSLLPWLKGLAGWQ